MVARPGRLARIFERGIVDLEIRERHLLLDQKVPAGDQHDLPGGEAVEQIHLLIPDHDRRRVSLNLLVGDDRRGEPALHRLHPDPHKRLAVDPDRAGIQRRVRLERLESHDVAVVALDTRRPVQPVPVALVEPQQQRQRQHLLGLQQRKRRAIRSPGRPIHRERELLPFDVGAGHEIAILGDDVVSGIGHRRPEVLLHAHPRDVGAHQRVLRALPRLVPGDHLGDGQLTLGADPAALGEHVGRAGVEVEQHRSAGQRHAARTRRVAGSRTKSAAAAVSRRADRRTTGVPSTASVIATRRRSARGCAPVGEQGRKRLVIEQQAMWQCCPHIVGTDEQLQSGGRLVERLDVVGEQRGNRRHRLERCRQRRRSPATPTSTRRCRHTGGPRRGDAAWSVADAESAVARSTLPAETISRRPDRCATATGGRHRWHPPEERGGRRTAPDPP